MVHWIMKPTPVTTSFAVLATSTDGALHQKLHNIRYDDVSDNNTFIGGAGDDVVSSGAGTDILLARDGNDSITIDGVGDKLADGGSGHDTLALDYNGDGVTDFAVSRISDGFVLTDPLGSSITARNIEEHSFGGSSYKLIYHGTDGAHSVNENSSYRDPASSPAPYIIDDYDEAYWSNNVISSAYFSNQDGEVFI